MRTTIATILAIAASAVSLKEAPVTRPAPVKQVDVRAKPVAAAPQRDYAPVMVSGRTDAGTRAEPVAATPQRDNASSDKATKKAANNAARQASRKA